MPSPHENLAARLLEGALQRGWGDRLALREGDRAWTYAHLADQAMRVATLLRTLRIARGERVAILMRDSLDTAAAILGVIYGGGVAVPLSELSRALDVRTYLEHSGAVAAIVHTSLEPTLDEVRTEVEGLREVMCVGGRHPGERDYHSAVRSAAPAPVASAVEGSDVAVLLYSAAGAALTQTLLGVPHRHETPLAAFASFAKGVLELGPDDRTFSLGRLNTAYGLGTGLFFPLAAGAEALLLPEQPHSARIFATVDEFDPTVMFATPSVYSQLARDAETGRRDRPLQRLRAAVSGAEGMPPKLVARARDILGIDVTVGYGITEAFQFVLCGDADPTGRPGACGRPVPGYQARIVDEHRVPVGPDIIGTLQIRGPTLLHRYWGEPDRDPLEDGWFTTRDRFLVDDRGAYHHCGRVDDLFKVSGKWVSPVEVERALMGHEAVWDCAVIGADDEDGLIKPLAFVVANVGHPPGGELEAELRAHVKNELAPYKYPRWIEFVDHLPKGPNGKLLRYKLRPAGRRRRAETASGEVVIGTQPARDGDED